METKLTAKDLMIEDWVLCVDSTHKEKTYAQIDGIEEGQTCILVRKDNRNWFLDIGFIEAIPLTAEVLEKNGFYFGYTSKQEDAASQIGCSCEKAWTYDEGGGSIQVTFPNECDGGLIVLDDQDFDKHLEFVFANQIYVHELQHALRLCGIDKEITL